MAKIIFILFSAGLVTAIVLLFLRKAGLQLQYLRIKEGQAAGNIRDFLFFDWQDAQARAQRWRAFLLFPMLYAVLLDDEQEELLKIKREVKRTHILIYLAVILFIILGVYSERIFPPENS